MTFGVTNNLVVLNYYIARLNDECSHSSLWIRGLYATIISQSLNYGVVASVRVVGHFRIVRKIGTKKLAKPDLFVNTVRHRGKTNLVER